MAANEISGSRRGAPQSILITGASSGIGRALARRFAGPGVHLHLAARNQARLDAAAAECGRLGADTSIAAIDVRDIEATRDMVEAAHSRRPLDLVVANAGITGGIARDRPLETVAASHAIIKTNLLGAINTVLPAAQLMTGQGFGQIAYVSSLAGLRGLPYSPAYCASKAAMIAHATSLRPTLRRHGVDVSIILPGFVETPLDDSISGPRPFRMSADRAARLIVRGLGRRRSRIVFPLPLSLGVLLLSRLPSAWGDRFLDRIVVEIPAPVDSGAND